MSSKLALLAMLAVAACSSGGGGSPPAASTFTVHYHRALSDYSSWMLVPTSGAADSSIASSGTDGFGAKYVVTLAQGATSLAFALKNGSATDPAGALSVDVSGTAREAWVFSGWAEAITRALPAIPGANQLAVYYGGRADGDYSGWGLHTWGDQVGLTDWNTPVLSHGVDPEFGSGFLLDRVTGGALLGCPAGNVCLIVHKGSLKDPGPDMTDWNPAVLGNIVFLMSGSLEITAMPRHPAAVSIAGASAHLLARDTVAWKVSDPDVTTYELSYSPTAAIAATADDVVGGTPIPLTPRPAGLSAALKAKVPHLAGPEWKVFDVAADVATLDTALRGQLVAVARKADGKAAVATKVQIPLALDDLYPYTGPLGVTFAAQVASFALWAPTAQEVTLEVIDDPVSTSSTEVTPVRDPATGVWSFTAPDASWYGKYYRYHVTAYHPLTGKVEHMTATDPYAVNLYTNGGWAQLVDLGDPAPSLMPPGWAALVKPPLAAPEDIVVYESHLRDFSAEDGSVAAADRGKYLAFTDTTSDGMKHLADLAAAGLTHLHLLPVFDIATIDEDPANRVDLDDDFSRLCAMNTSVPTATCGAFTGMTIRQAMASYPGDSDQEQQIAAWMRALDSFNWGYDPFHYGAPEGSYASTAAGPAKILEFREMVQALAGIGLRVVMDVVYNHTNAAGVAPKSVLDQVVPGYYHRLDPETGMVLTSSCCANTATEHAMMERLMVDTLVRWARDYKVDGFRFDLMGLHLKDDVLKAQQALAALTPATDGVDGASIYLYGEGWSMGETQGDVLGTAATQLNMGGTGIGTFNDRIRDGARGGGPFDSGTDIRKNQGFSSGLFLDPNELNTGADAERLKLEAATDLIRVGMAGNLRNFRIQKANGFTTIGAGVGYNGAQAGYTLDPQEDVNYCSAHDNQILFDIVMAKLPTGTPVADRVRAVELAQDVVMLGQGVPFFHMGDDLLRSKSMEGNSYDSGDWFNRVDWSGQTTAWKSGLPSLANDGANWPMIRPLFADTTIAPAPADIAAARGHFLEMLAVRKGSILFRLRSADDVMKRVDFLNTGAGSQPGVIAMTVTDGSCAGADLDPAVDGFVVIVNPDKVSHSVTVPGAAAAVLHPVLASGADPVVKTSTVAPSGSDATLTVPARTTGVFELPQSGAQGAGLPCNTR